MTKGKPIEEIIGDIPENLSEIEKVRYIYLKLGKYFIYNINFIINQDEDEMKKKVYKKEINLENLYTRKHVCSQIAYALAGAINKMAPGIQASTMYRSTHQLGEDEEYGETEHMATKIETKDGEKYLLDLTLDLYRIQNNLQTKEFGFSSYIDDDYDIISLREAREMDNKIGYTYNGIYMNEFINQMKKEMLDDELVKEYVVGNNITKINHDTILKYKLDFILKNLDLKNNGPIEAKEFVVYALEEILTPSEQRRVKQFNLYKKGDTSKMGVALRLICGDDRYYYLRKEDGNFKEVKLDNICEMIQNEEWFIKSRTIANESRDSGYSL